MSSGPDAEQTISVCSPGIHPVGTAPRPSSAIASSNAASFLVHLGEFAPPIRGIVNASRLATYRPQRRIHLRLAARSAISAPFSAPKAAFMKSEGHPDYHFIEVVLTDGSRYKTRSTYGEEGAVLNLDIDPKTHPAWTGGAGALVDRGGRVSRFNEKFGGFFKK